MIVLLASPLSVLEERAPWKTGLDVGKRALTMLLNEIYREDLRYALAINEAVRSHLELRARLDDQLGSAMTERILAGLEFPFAPPQYRAVQIRAAVPDRDFADALEFDPRKIREAMDAGRAAARHLLEERELSAMLDHLETKQQPLAA
jgi:NTE family protein